MLFYIFYAIPLIIGFFCSLFFPVVIFYIGNNSFSFIKFKSFLFTNSLSLILYYPVNVFMFKLCNIDFVYQNYIIYLYCLIILLQIFLIAISKKFIYFLLLISCIFINCLIFMINWSKECVFYENIREEKAYMLYFAGIFGVLIIGYITIRFFIKKILILFKNLSTKIKK